MNKVRIDKWLWSVRIFKSRSLATKACKSRKVKINDEIVKPAQSVERGDVVRVVKNGYNLVFRVVDLIEKRVSAKLAQPCYEDLTPQAEYDKYRDWFKGKAGAEVREKGAGRPTKRQRRKLEEYKEELWWEGLEGDE